VQDPKFKRMLRNITISRILIDIVVLLCGFFWLLPPMGYSANLNKNSEHGIKYFIDYCTYTSKAVENTRMVRIVPWKCSECSKKIKGCKSALFVDFIGAVGNEQQDFVLHNTHNTTNPPSFLLGVCTGFHEDMPFLFGKADVLRIVFYFRTEVLPVVSWNPITKTLTLIDTQAVLLKAQEKILKETKETSAIKLPPSLPPIVSKKDTTTTVGNDTKDAKQSLPPALPPGLPQDLPQGGENTLVAATYEAVAWNLLKQGKKKEAKTWFKKALNSVEDEKVKERLRSIITKQCE
jgi:hypothetical protein